MCYPVCGMVHIKEPLLLIEKSSLSGGSGFPRSLSECFFTISLTPYNRKQNVLSASLNKTSLSLSKRIAFLMCGRIEIDPRLRMFVLFYLICVVAGTGPRTLDLSSHHDQYVSHCSTAGHAKRRQMAICFRPAATDAKNGDDRRFLWTDPEGAIISVDVVPRHLPFALINTNLSPAKRPNGQNLTNI